MSRSKDVVIRADEGNVELETLGALQTLQKGGSAVLQETWEVIVEEFPANAETARIILGRLR